MSTDNSTYQSPSEQLLAGLKSSKGYKARSNRPVEDTQSGETHHAATPLAEVSSSPVDPVSVALNEGSLPTDPVDQELFVDWKKRYDDSRSFINKLQDEKKALEAKLTSGDKSIPLPQTEDEVDEWKQSNPDLYEKITTIINKEVKPLKEVITQKETQERNTRIFNEVKQSHSDADEIRKSPLFSNWFAEQTPAIKALIESTEPKDIVRGINLFKSDVEWKKPVATSQQAGKTAEDASAVIVKGGSTFTPQSQKKVWSDKEVREMSPKDFAKYQTEINLAKREGRYQFG
jgi:D-ribose pyranose/furanose isomerase RbsD